MAGERIYGDLIVEDNAQFVGNITVGRANVSGTQKVVTILSSDTNCGLDIDTQGTGILRVPTGYEANILSEARALVNRAYADARLASKLIPTPGASQDGQVPQYNHSSGEFTFVTPGGGGGGSVTFGSATQVPFMNAGATDFTYSSLYAFDSTNIALTIGSSIIHTRGGSTNFFAGNSVANFTLTGNENVGIGGSVLQSLSSGIRNVVIGYIAGLQISAGGNNTIIGAESGVALQTGSSNTLIGAIQANLLTGSSNTLIGSAAGFGNITSASSCIIIGAGCGLASGSANGQMSIQNIIYGTGNTTSGSSVGLGSIGIGTAAPDRRFHVEQNTATTNAVTYVQRLTSTSSGTPAAGIGVGIEFEVETSVANNEVGATIEAVVVDATGASEDFDLVFKVMRAGAAAAEILRVAPSGGGTASGITSPGLVEFISTTHQISAPTLINGNIKAGITGDSTIDRRLHVEENISSGTATLYPIRMTSISTGSISAGFGVGIEFEAETTSSNNEVGATIEAVTTDVTAASEDFDLVFKTMVAGAAATEHLRFGSNKIGFLGATSVVRQAGLTAITHTAPGTPDYSIQDLTAGGFGFVTKDEGNTVLSIVKAMHDAMKAYGLLT